MPQGKRQGWIAQLAHDAYHRAHLIPPDLDRIDMNDPIYLAIILGIDGDRERLFRALEGKLSGVVPMDLLLKARREVLEDLRLAA